MTVLIEWKKVKIIDTGIEDVKIIEPRVFRDQRGYFLESFNLELFKEAGLPTVFAQDNHSFSQPKVLRGLHFQNNPAQGKLVTVARGAVWDVAVDLRPNSKTFLKYAAVELNDQNCRSVWIPAGFAHGFCVISSEPADVIYKVDAPYNSKTEGGILWNDSELGIPWPKEEPILSDRDKKLMTIREYLKWLQTSK